MNSNERPRDQLVREWRLRKKSEELSSAVDACQERNAYRRPPGPASGAARALSKRFSDIIGRQGDNDVEPKYCNSFWSQARALGRRSLIQKRGSLVEPVAFVLLGIATSTSIFWVRLGHSEKNLDDRTGALFFFAALWSFTSCLASLHTFPPEKAVLNKDRASGIYRLSAYYVGKNCVEMPLEVIYPFLFSLTVYFVIGFNTTGVEHFFIFWLLLILIDLAASSEGIAMSAAVMDTKWAQALSTGFLLMSLLAGGYYSDTVNQPIWIRWTRYLSAIRYVYESLVRNEFSGETYACETDPALHTAYSAGGTICPVTEDAALRGAQVDDSLPVVGNVAFLVFWIAFVRLLGYLALKHFHVRHKPRSRHLVRH